jgi:hypothetical protein
VSPFCDPPLLRGSVEHRLLALFDRAAGLLGASARGGTPTVLAGSFRNRSRSIAAGQALSHTSPLSKTAEVVLAVRVGQEVHEVLWAGDAALIACHGFGRGRRRSRTLVDADIGREAAQGAARFGRDEEIVGGSQWATSYSRRALRSGRPQSRWRGVSANARADHAESRR